MIFFTQNVDLAIFILRLALVIILFSRGPAAAYTEAFQKKIRLPILSRGIIETLVGMCVLVGWGYAGSLLLIILLFLYDLFLTIELKDTPFSSERGWQYEFVLLVLSLALLLAGPGTYIL